MRPTVSIIVIVNMLLLNVKFIFCKPAELEGRGLEGGIILCLSLGPL